MLTGKIRIKLIKLYSLNVVAVDPYQFKHYILKLITSTDLNLQNKLRVNMKQIF